MRSEINELEDGWETADIIVYEPDLLFSSRIEAAAAKAGVDVKFVSNLQEIAQHLRQIAPRAIFLNLDAAEGRLGGLEEFVKKGSFRTVGYYSHVNAPLAVEARGVGIGTVLSRGVFAARLDQILRDMGSG